MKNLPQKPGIYIFKNDKKEILYDGNAKNLQKNDTSYFTDISMNSIFPAYLDTFSFDSSPYDTSLYIDTTGVFNYTWKIVAQNYSRDIYRHDIFYCIYYFESYFVVFRINSFLVKIIA